ncbi:FLAVONOID 3'-MONOOXYGENASE-RELATED [Salix viminalis]|uniref:FLAVONOID 3'-MONOOXYGENASE-RELATED n=1 Tax=Salix viminalis TaxID=40686 RepID=A0A9Q0NM88_SALVM|nr:FLAVONOID 3'-MONOOXYGENASE-RELATED [Salix viminalis]
MFVAGTDTTFIILDWAMTEHIMNPNAMEKAQDEVRGVVGDLLLPRESLEDVIIDGYNILAKTRIYVNVRGMGRDPNCGKIPETFEPKDLSAALPLGVEAMDVDNTEAFGISMHGDDSPCDAVAKPRLRLTPDVSGSYYSVILNL